MNRYGMACAVAFAAALFGGAACVTSENRCVEGFEFVSTYKACVPVADASATDASSVDGAAADGGDGGDGGAAISASGLGDSCGGDPDCAGKKASYCLKDPLAPSDPGICSVPQCTATDCGEQHRCCDCGSAAVPELQAWPRGVCLPSDQVSTVQSFGCVCP